LTKSAEIQKLSQQWEEETKGEVELAVKKVQLIGSDILGFDDTVERDQLKLWKTIESKWGDIFPGVTVEVSVKTFILRTGMRTKPSISGK
jgi:spore germination protein KC